MSSASAGVVSARTRLVALELVAQGCGDAVDRLVAAVPLCFRRHICKPVIAGGVGRFEDLERCGGHWLIDRDNTRIVPPNEPRWVAMSKSANPQPDGPLQDQPPGAAADLR